MYQVWCITIGGGSVEILSRTLTYWHAPTLYHGINQEVSDSFHTQKGTHLEDTMTTPDSVNHFNILRDFLWICCP